MDVVRVGVRICVGGFINIMAYNLCLGMCCIFAVYDVVELRMWTVGFLSAEMIGGDGFR